MASNLKSEDECGIYGLFGSSSTTRHLDLNTTEGRLQTFINWPPFHPIQPIDLAEAGFYSLGKNNYSQFSESDI